MVGARFSGFVDSQSVHSDIITIQEGIWHARFGGTVLVDCDLSDCVGLDTQGELSYLGPSFIDHLTLRKSGRLPTSFLRGVGLPENFIDYIPSLFWENPLDFYSCFISYSSEDKDFAERLHADLQNRGVRCWFAPKDLKIGADIADTIDRTIRTRDKVLLILSQNSIASPWVEEEVKKGYAEERRRGEPVLFPVRVDSAIQKSEKPWARKLWENCNIGDFSGWQEDEAEFQAEMEKVIKALRADSDERKD